MGIGEGGEKVLVLDASPCPPLPLFFPKIHLKKHTPLPDPFLSPPKFFPLVIVKAFTASVWKETVIVKCSSSQTVTKKMKAAFVFGCSISGKSLGRT